MKVTKTFYECAVCHGHSEKDNLRFKLYDNSDGCYMVQAGPVSNYEEGICSDECVEASLKAFLAEQRKRLEAVKIRKATVAMEIKSTTVSAETGTVTFDGIKSA